MSDSTFNPSTDKGHWEDVKDVVACTGDPLGPKNGFKCFQVAQFFRDSEEFLGCKDVHGKKYHKYQLSRMLFKSNGNPLDPMMDILRLDK